MAIKRYDYQIEYTPITPNFVKQYRLSRGLAQKEMAELLGLKQNYYSRLENSFDPFPRWVKKFTKLSPNDVLEYLDLK